MVLAVVAAVLAYVLQNDWLYAVAAVLVLIAGILLMEVMRRRHRQARKPYGRQQQELSDADAELKSLGIVDIRPKEKSRSVNAPPVADASPEASLVAALPEAALPDAIKAKMHAAEAAVEEDYAPPGGPRPVDPDQAALDRQRRDDILVPCLRALRASLGVKTACLLQHAPLAAHHEYRIVALNSDRKGARLRGKFHTSDPLPVPTRGVAVEIVGEGGVPMSHLGYYQNPSGLRHVALAPVPYPASEQTYFVLADATEDVLSASRARNVMMQFGRLLGALLEEPLDVEAEEAAPPVRPRREIIAEEMERARADGVPLALALVHIREAEDIADEGDDAIARVEQQLADFLQQTAPEGRVERFGELTYGVFYTGTVTEVETWTQQVEEELDDETGLLEGGVTIGVAMMQGRHENAVDFRHDATEALREAYESGTSVILE